MKSEWEEVSILDVAPITSKLVNPKDEKYSSMILIAPDHIQSESGQIIAKATAREQNAISGKYLVKKGDVIYSKIRPYLKKVCIAPENCLCSADMYPFSCTEQINSKYLQTLLLSKQFTDYANSCSARTGIPKINRDDIALFFCKIPPIPEQEKIAETLSIWDSAIEKTEKLISEKEKMFSFLLKRILSKKENTCYLNKIVTIKKGNQLNKENMISNGTVPVLNGGISYSGFTNFANTQKNTIAISEGGNSCGYVNFVSEDFWAGGHCYTLELKNKDVETKFLYWMLKSKEKEIMKLRVGSGLPNIQQNDLCNLKIEIYNKNDQLKIIELLDCQQREISLLKKQLEQYKLQKQGLMQKLLTGEWRVK